MNYYTDKSGLDDRRHCRARRLGRIFNAVQRNLFYLLRNFRERFASFRSDDRAEELCGSARLADEGLCAFIRIVDDSAAYSLLADMDSRQIQYDPLDEAIKAGLLKNAKYDRVIDLNFITVTVGYPEIV